MVILFWICGNCVYVWCEIRVLIFGVGFGLDIWRGVESK